MLRTLRLMLDPSQTPSEKKTKMRQVLTILAFPQKNDKFGTVLEEWEEWTPGIWRDRRKEKRNVAQRTWF